MKTYCFETCTYNSDYEGGFEEACEASDDAAARWPQSFLDLLEELGLGEWEAGGEAEKVATMGVTLVDGPTFVECDSTRSHGSCYWEVKVELPDELYERIEKAG
jgi:hypothetical protein